MSALGRQSPFLKRQKLRQSGHKDLLGVGLFGANTCR